MQQWFHNWPWIHYDEVNGIAFCHTCVTAVSSKKLKNVLSNGDVAFIHRGYANWKDASGKTGASVSLNLVLSTSKLLR